METTIKAIDNAGLDVALKATKGGQLYNIPPQIVWTAKQYGVQAMATAAVAALVVRPTTTAMATLWNGDPSKYYVIDRAFAHNLVGVANSAFQIWLCVHPVGMAKPTNDITVRNNTAGKAAGGSSSIFDNGATVVDDGWFIWDYQGTTITVTVPGGNLCAEINGRIILPPTAALSMHITASTTSATFTPGFHWYEVPATELFG
jgi:hypothetical protein